MSVVSSRVSSVSSILKGTGVRSQLIKQSSRVYFKLPNDIKRILCDFEAGNGIKEYKNLIHLLREGVIKDSDLAEFLAEARQCISSLGIKHELFIQVLLQLQWTNRSSEVTSAYKLFLQDLVCMQLCHLKAVINHLVQLFKPVEDAEHKVEKVKLENIERLNHIHDILHKILEVIPMSNTVLLQSLGSQFPYVKHGTYTHEVYIFALLQILNYAPQLRSDILSLITNRLTVLDVNIPRDKITDDNEKDDVIDDNIDRNETSNDQTELDIDADETTIVHPTARTLDTCMELFLKYMHEFCFANDVLKIEQLRILYLDILRAFETVILPTHASQYVQYIMFYICSFKPVVAETFTDWLWRKVIDPNVAPVLRQTAVCYISSLLASASYVSHGLIRLTMFKLTKWIQNYIAMQECSEFVDDDAKAHVVFYSVCQAFFYLFIARYKEFVTSNDGIIFLQELGISSIISCKLNPLRICDTEIVHKFADITSTYQLAYCYTVIETNERNQLPIFGTKSHSSVLVSSFFPFESCTFQHSRQRLSPLFRNNVMNTESDK